MSRDSWYPSCRVCQPEKTCFPPPMCSPWPDFNGGNCREPGHTMSLSIFGKSCGCDKRGITPAAPPVTVVNPWNCREKAMVFLGIDECGNLVVSVRRDG